MKTRTAILISSLCAGALLALPALASPEHQHSTASSKAPASSSRSEGTIKKIDKKAGKVVLSHGPLLNLNMPAMTMTFVVKNSQSLDGLKAGDKVSFVAEEINGVLSASALQAAP